MTNVSKNKLAPSVFKRIRRDLRHAVSSRMANGPQILESLLSPTERVMLSKRLAIIILLENKCTYYKISKVLKVSIATVLRTERLRKQGKFTVIQSTVRKNDLTFFENMELMLSMGMPSRAGPSYSTRLKLLKTRKRKM